MKFLIVGCGSIGKRHIRNLKTLGDFEIVVADRDEGRLNEVAAKYGAKTFVDLIEALKEKPNAVFICTPNNLHIEQALLAAQMGCNIFMEKPLSHNLNNVNELSELINKRGLSFLMASNWKFHPSFKKIKKMLEDNIIGKVLSFTVLAGQYLPDWHPFEDYRKGYSANSSLGGGVLLDYFHEFDYIQWFLGPIKKLACLTGKYSDLEMDTEDVGEVIVELESRTIGNIHVDYIQHPYRRSIYFYGEKGVIEWSFRENKICLYLSDKKKWQIFEGEANYDLNQMYLEEVKHFVNILLGKEKPISDLDNAKQVLAVIETAKQSSKLEKVITL